MPPDALISDQNVFGKRAPPGSAGELTSLPRPPSWIQGLLLREREGNSPNFASRFRRDRSPHTKLYTNMIRIVVALALLLACC